ncbi:hypothetical protein CANARDRAFT_202714 [[Candida] arabinofermentans NRRL YB-2248]|uniref:Survival protein SurE-like phosphatase/nucleotidase domain-containing protein n=1 Tax=[Candida] arabinofermentans NRRL YB-2248 TaxID=983967 RepID=A0A1E4SVY9_9ASCO|nr:hypothetical protein CANARDRAFT_202714 [[Candida] arabinofermentans NRRL YB-2248]
MQFSSLLALATILITNASAKNILLTNDDGWAATNIRALYRDLKNAGHNVVMVAPAVQYSGNGGRFIIPSTNTLTTGALFDYPPAGSPAWGHEEDDLNAWYFSGSPAACVAMGLDYVIPTYFNNMTIDLVVGGPNEGTNMGQRDFALSGTMGATYYATERGYPAMAISGSNGNNSFFKDNLDDNEKNAYNIYAKASLKIIDTLFDSQVDGERLLPLSTALNVNYPSAGDDLSSDCYDLTFKKARLTGSNSLVYYGVYNETTGLIASKPISSKAVQQCLTGDCDLPDEFTIIGNNQCEGTIAAFTLDLDSNLSLLAETENLFSEKRHNSQSYILQGVSTKRGNIFTPNSSTNTSTTNHLTVQRNKLSKTPTPTISNFEVPASPKTKAIAKVFEAGDMSVAGSSELNEIPQTSRTNIQHSSSSNKTNSNRHNRRQSTETVMSQPPPLTQQQQPPQQRIITEEEQILASNLQETYKAILKLEVETQQGCAEVNARLIENDAGAEITPQLWLVYKSVIQLLDQYYDFLLYALSPSSARAGKPLVTNYRILRRMWVYGVVSFLEVLKNVAAIFVEHEVCGCFISYAFNIIGCLTDAQLGVEGWWAEKLGDLSRMAIALYPANYMDWKVSSVYWYQLAMKTQFGHGKIYYHMCTVESDNLEALVDIGKSVTCRDPFVPTPQYLRMIVDNVCSQRNILSSIEMAMIDFVKIHKILMMPNYNTNQEMANLVSHYSLHFGLDSSSVDFFQLRGDLGTSLSIDKVNFWFQKSANFALCNISHLIGFGDSKNPFAKLFELPEALKQRKDKKDKRRKSKNDNSNDESNSKLNDFEAINNSTASEQDENSWFLLLDFINKGVLELSMIMLKNYITGPIQTSTPHIIVWMYFIISVGEATKKYPLGKQMFNYFITRYIPWAKLVPYLNDILCIVRSDPEMRKILKEHTLSFPNSQSGDRKEILKYLSDNERLWEVWKCWGSLWFDNISLKRDYATVYEAGVKSDIFDLPTSGLRYDPKNDAHRYIRLILLGTYIADNFPEFGLIRSHNVFKFKVNHEALLCESSITSVAYFSQDLRFQNLFEKPHSALTIVNEEDIIPVTDPLIWCGEGEIPAALPTWTLNSYGFMTEYFNKNYSNSGPAQNNYTTSSDHNGMNFNELRSLRRSSDASVADSATRAVIIIRQLYNDKDILPVRADGTKASTLNETLEFQKNQNWRSNTDEIIMKAIKLNDDLGKSLLYKTGSHSYDIPKKTRELEIAALLAKLEAKPTFNPNLKFDPKKHIIFSDEKFEGTKTVTLQEIGINKTRTAPVCDFAAAYPFPLISQECADMLLWELFQPDVIDKWARLTNAGLSKGATRLDFHVGAHCRMKAKFSHDFYNSPELSAIVSKVVGFKVSNIYDSEVGHTNVSLASLDPEEARSKLSAASMIEEYKSQNEKKGHEIPSTLGLHYDSVTFALVVMLDLGEGAVGGETGIITGDDKVFRVPDPKVGYATLIQGMVLRHVATKPVSNSNRITGVCGFQSAGPEILDNCRITSTKPSVLPRMPYNQFYRDWFDFRFKNLANHLKYQREQVMERFEKGEEFDQLAMIDICKNMEKYLHDSWKEMEAVHNPPYPPPEFQMPYDQLPDN